MPKRRGQGLKNFDDALYILTGVRMKNIAKSFLNSFGEDITRKVSKKAAEFFTFPDEVKLPDDSPYRVLGVNPDAPDFLVRGAYKVLMKKYHPDGEAPNEEMAKKINHAYDQICTEREMPK